MPLIKRSRLHKVLLDFDEGGTYVTGEALFQEGAWDEDTKDWHGKPIENEYPLSNLDARGQTFFNDVIGVAAAKAFDEAARCKADAETSAVTATGALERERIALGARDNFAALHKEATALAISRATQRDAYRDEMYETRDKLVKIPRLLRRLFGAL